MARLVLQIDVDDRGTPKVKQYRDTVASTRGTMNQFKDGTRQAGDEMNRMGGIASRIGGYFGSLKGMITGAVASWVSYSAITSMVDKARMSALVDRKIETAVNATGAAAGYTAKELKGMASELANVTNFGATTVKQGEAMLLMYTKVGREAFPLVMERALDMATLMSNEVVPSVGEVQAAVQKLGRAMQGPQGLMGLKRGSISLPDSEIQRLKKIHEENGLLAYQKQLLDDIGSRVGGQARAAAEGYLGSFDRMKKSVEGLKRSIGEIIFPVFGERANAFTEFVKNIRASVEANRAAISQNVAGWLGGISAAGKLAADNIWILVAAVKALVAYQLASWALSSAGAIKFLCSAVVQAISVMIEFRSAQAGIMALMAAAPASWGLSWAKAGTIIKTGIIGALIYGAYELGKWMVQCPDMFQATLLILQGHVANFLVYLGSFAAKGAAVFVELGSSIATGITNGIMKGRVSVEGFMEKMIPGYQMSQASKDFKPEQGPSIKDRIKASWAEIDKNASKERADNTNYYGQAADYILDLKNMATASAAAGDTTGKLGKGLGVVDDEASGAKLRIAELTAAIDGLKASASAAKELAGLKVEAGLTTDVAAAKEEYEWQRKIITAEMDKAKYARDAADATAEQEVSAKQDLRNLQIQLETMKQSAALQETIRSHKAEIARMDAAITESQLREERVQASNQNFSNNPVTALKAEIDAHRQTLELQLQRSQKALQYEGHLEKQTELQNEIKKLQGEINDRESSSLALRKAISDQVKGILESTKTEGEQTEATIARLKETMGSGLLNPSEVEQYTKAIDILQGRTTAYGRYMEDLKNQTKDWSVIGVSAMQSMESAGDGISNIDGDGDGEILNSLEDDVHEHADRFYSCNEPDDHEADDLRGFRRDGFRWRGREWRWREFMVERTLAFSEFGEHVDANLCRESGERCGFPFSKTRRRGQHDQFRYKSEAWGIFRPNGGQFEQVGGYGHYPEHHEHDP